AILANCIEEIQSGKSTIEDCIKRYPHLGNELRSLLEIATCLKPDEVTPSPQFKERVKMHLFEEIRHEPMKVSQSMWKWYRTPSRILVPVSIAILILVVAGGSTVYASQSSLP